MPEAETAARSAATCARAATSSAISWPNWCACRPTTRPATARRMPSAPRRCWRRWVSPSSATSCRQDLVARHGMVSATNLIVRRRFGDGPVVALNAHGDVVPPGEGWTADPYGAEIRDGWMYGRGAAVSKSDFATYAFALLALQQAARPSRGTVELHFTYDEESGGEIGPALAAGAGHQPPRLRDRRRLLLRRHRSRITAACIWKWSVTGRSAHAARPSTGIDALEAATHAAGGAVCSGARPWPGGSPLLPASAPRNSPSG